MGIAELEVLQYRLGYGAFSIYEQYRYSMFSVLDSTPKPVERRVATAPTGEFPLPGGFSCPLLHAYEELFHSLAQRGATGGF